MKRLFTVLGILFALSTVSPAQTRWGYLDMNGDYAVPFIYINARDFSEGLAAVSDGYGWGFVGLDGKVAIALDYEDAMDFGSGLAPVKKDGKWGYVNRAGELVVPCIYDKAAQLQYGWAKVERDGVKAWLGASGAEVFTAEQAASYQVFIPCGQNRVVAKKNGSYGVLGEDGTPITNFEYTTLSRYSDGRAKVSKGGNIGYLGLDGSLAIPMQYSSAQDFNGGLAKVSTGGEYFFIDTLGQTAFVCSSDLFYKEFRDGFAAVRKDGKWGFVNSAGELVVPCIYNSVKDFSGSLAGVNMNGKWGLVNDKGVVVVEPQFGSIKEIRDGGAVISKDGKLGLINSEGKVLADFQYDVLEAPSEGRFRFIGDGEAYLWHVASAQKSVKGYEEFLRNGIYSDEHEALARKFLTDVDDYLYNSALKKGTPPALIAYKKQTEGRMVRQHVADANQTMRDWDEAAWKAVENSTNPQDFRDYMDKTSDNPYASHHKHAQGKIYLIAAHHAYNGKDYENGLTLLEQVSRHGIPLSPEENEMYNQCRLHHNFELDIKDFEANPTYEAGQAFMNKYMSNMIDADMRVRFAMVVGQKLDKKNKRLADDILKFYLRGLGRKDIEDYIKDCKKAL